MTSMLTRLLSTGSAAIASSLPSDARLRRAFGDAATDALMVVFHEKNGVYAFEGALHVLAELHEDGPETGIVGWNDSALWRGEYGGMAASGVFFAEDVFGNQFCLRDDGVFAFDSETGAHERMAADLEEWAAHVLKDFELWTGFRLAHQWQVKHGQIPAGKRLLAKTPFVLGGPYSVENLYDGNAVKGMRYRGSIATQIRDLPDGTPIKLQVVD